MIIAIIFLLAPEQRARRKEAPEVSEAVKPIVTRRLGPKSFGDDNTVVDRPPRTKALGFSVEEKDGLRETIAKLESSLAPDELQIFYTDLLLKDWIIFRDNLTEGVGWNGVFLQIDDKQRRLGIFAVVKEIGGGGTSVESLSTRISIIKVEEI